MRTCFGLVVTKFTWIDVVFRFLLDKGITFESPIGKVSKLPICLLKRGQQHLFFLLLGASLVDQSVDKV